MHTLSRSSDYSGITRQTSPEIQGRSLIAIEHVDRIDSKGIRKSLARAIKLLGITFLVDARVGAVDCLGAEATGYSQCLRLFLRAKRILTSMSVNVFPGNTDKGG